MELDKDFREFIELLNEHNVKYLVIGGYAVNFHGYPRYTKDIDFIMKISLVSSTARRSDTLTDRCVGSPMKFGN